MKYKVGDKVRIIKIRDEVNGRANKFLNQVGIIVGYWEECYLLNLDGGAFEWYEEELEPITETLFDRIKSAIIEAAKQSPIIIEQTEDGGIKISPIEEKEDLPIDTPVMVTIKNNDGWYLRYYAGKGRVFTYGHKSNEAVSTLEYDEIIPFDKFNPNDIEESLKHNIVK